MWERFYHPNNLHSVGAIEIDHANGLVRKTFSLSHIATHKAWLADSTEDDVTAFFLNDVHWLQKLWSMGLDFIPRLIDVDERRRSYVMPYYGPDILTSHVAARRQHELVSQGITSQIIDHFKAYGLANIYKFNNASINYCLDGKRLVAIDFKWACERDSTSWHRSISDKRQNELHSIETWISKIDPNIVDDLKKLV